MSTGLFGLSDEPFAKLEPLLPTDTRGRERIDDRRVIGGVIHVLKPGGRWVDASPDYGLARPGAKSAGAVRDLRGADPLSGRDILPFPRPLGERLGF
jgi:hypothetical protein